MKKDFTAWLLLPCLLLALSSVTVLAPHQAALAGPPAAPKTVSQAPDDDGDGDELLEHWGDPQFSREEQTQMAGMAAGFLLLGTAAGVRRARRCRRKTVLPASASCSDIHSDLQPDTRKAA